MSELTTLEQVVVGEAEEVDEDTVHIMCCVDDDLAYCGADVTDMEEVPELPEDRTCKHCKHVDDLMNTNDRGYCDNYCPLNVIGQL